MSKKIAVIVDNPLRDLPACTLLSTALAEQGYECHLISFDNAAQGCFSIQPDYVLANYARVTNEKLIKRLLAARIPVGILDTEGGVFFKMDDGTLNVSKTFSTCEKFKSGLSDYFVWGRHFYNYLAEKGPFSPEILRLTGSPRTDILHPSLRSSRVNKDIILINTSFPFANPKFKSPEEEIQNLKKQTGYSEPFLRETMASQTKTFYNFIDLAAFIVQQFPDEKFVLRPHPFEGHETYQKRLSHLPNLEIRGDQTIDVWLERSKALVHFECSTALEAALMGVPALALKETAALRPIEAVGLVTDYCDSKEEIVEKLRAILSGRYSSPPQLLANKLKIIEDVYLKFDGENYREISKCIMRAINGSSNKKSFVAQFWRVFYYLRNQVKKLMRKPIIRTEKNFSPDDVRHILEGLKASPTAIGSKIDVRFEGTHSVMRQKKENTDAFV